MSIEGLESSMDRYFDDSYIIEELDKGRIVGTVEGQKVLAFATVERDIDTFIFPTSEHSLYDLLETFDYKEEPAIAFSSFGVDPMVRKQGLGKELMLSLFAKYKNHTWFTRVGRKNKPFLNFLTKLGFYPIGEFSTPEEAILVRPFVQDGLCRNIIW